MDKLLTVLPYALACAAVVTGIAVLINFVIKNVLRRGENGPSKEEIEEAAISLVREAEAATPKCPCGAVATHSPPRLVRSRTGWLRAFFGGSPLYRRRVVVTDIPVFCESHAHVADSMMDRFIYERIRAIQAETNERICVEAAAFETENLLDKIRDSIEAPKKKNEAIHSQPPVRLLAGGTK